ncbi:BatD family protein, partial [Bacteroidota bacterium]
TQWVNGKMTVQSSNSYTYVCRASKEGEITFPPTLVKVKKTEYKTNEVKVNVLGTSASGTSGSTNSNNVSQQGTTPAPEESEAVYLRVIPSKSEVYVGEQLVSELKIYTRVNTRPTGGLKDIPYEGFYKHAIDPDQTSQREMINGESYVTQVIQRHVLIPQKSGKMVIEPFSSEWTIPQRVQRNRPGSAFDDFFDPFNDPFFNSVQNVPTLLYTKPVTIKVKPFPEGAPEGFTGGVGSLKMTAELSSMKVTENDALSLVIKISGVGNISLLGAPKVDFPPDHDVYEPTRSQKISSSGNRISGTATFEYPMVARHAGSFRISPVKFAWFDPASKTYKTIETEEFNFVVNKGEGDDLSGQVYVPGMSAESVENIGTDILDIQRNSSGFAKIGYTPLSKAWYWLIYLLFAIMFVTIGGLLRIYFKRRADVRLIRNRKANRLARSRLKKADKARKAGKAALFFEETEKAIWGYLGDKLGIELSSLSREKVIDVLNNTKVSEEDKTELFRIMDECEFSRYAPSEEKSNMDLLYQDAIKLINQLEQNIQ